VNPTFGAYATRHWPIHFATMTKAFHAKRGRQKAKSGKSKGFPFEPSALSKLPRFA